MVERDRNQAHFKADPMVPVPEVRLHLAAAGGDVAVAGALIAAHPALLDHTDAWGNSALHTAARYGQAAVCKLLLDAGAVPTLRNGSGDTPVMVCCRNGHDAALAELLAVGCDHAALSDTGDVRA